MAGRRFFIIHKVYLNETNAMGGVVYFSNFVKWQGMVREAFLTQAVPGWPALFEESRAGNLNMITVEEYSKLIDHAYFGDEIVIRINAFDLKKLSFKILFEMTKKSTDKMIYNGWQKLAFHNKEGQLIPIPSSLFDAVLEYSPIEEVEKFKANYLNESHSILNQ